MSHSLLVISTWGVLSAPQTHRACSSAFLPVIVALQEAVFWCLSSPCLVFDTVTLKAVALGLWPHFPGHFWLDWEWSVDPRETTETLSPKTLNWVRWYWTLQPEDHKTWCKDKCHSNPELHASSCNVCLCLREGWRGGREETLAEEVNGESKTD